ncbi:MAG: hypothetical protein ACO20H_05850 [Bacteriovoracaceae bacterium]
MKKLFLFLLFPCLLSAKSNEGYDFPLSILYTISKSNFKEVIKQNGTTLNSSQNSLLTLGLSGAIHPRNSSLYFYSWNFYYAQLTSGETTLNQKLNPPPEWGLNIHYNRNIENWYVSPFAGIDVENFSTYNSDEAVLTNSPLEFRQHNISYATIGASKAFRVDQVNFFAKIGLSYSVYSSSSKKSALSDKDFSGFKYIFHFDFSLTEKASLHMFYKKHIMDGSTELKISRFGVGLGYELF